MKSLVIFFSEVFSELKKVQWLDRSEFIFLIISTFIIIFAFSVFFGIVDTIIGYSINKIINFFV